MSTDLRDIIRKNAFTHSVKKDIFDLNGQKIEIRQFGVGILEDLREQAKTDSELGFLSIIESCYVPGTDIKVFDITDIEGMKKCPAGGWVTKVITKIGELIGGTDTAKKS